MNGSYCVRHELPLFNGGCEDCDLELALYVEELDRALESNPNLFSEMEGR